MKYIIGIAIISLTPLLFSCGNTPCARGDLRFNLIGFSDAESDTIIIRRYQKTTSVIIDTLLVGASNQISYIRFGDTLRVGGLSSSILLLSDFDYQILFPGASRNFSITEINEQISSTNRGLFNTSKVGCINPIISCKINGQATNTIIFPNSIYLKK